MALDQSALLEVLEALKAAEVDDRIRQAAQTIYQALIEAELSSVIGAMPHQPDGHAHRTPQRAPAADGHHHGRGSGAADTQAPGWVVLPVTARAAPAGGPVPVRGDHGGEWAYSDLVSNDVRGVVAEYLVGLALDCLRSPRPGWVGWDLDYGSARIEVKAAGVVQAWAPPKKPRSLVFTIGARRAWDPITNEVAPKPLRSAHVFVFCHHHSYEDDWRRVIDTRQWSFHVVSTALLDRELPTAKTVSLPVVERYCLAGEGRTTDFSGINSAVDETLAKRASRLLRTRAEGGLDRALGALTVWQHAQARCSGYIWTCPRLCCHGAA